MNTRSILLSVGAMLFSLNQGFAQVPQGTPEIPEQYSSVELSPTDELYLNDEVNWNQGSSTGIEIYSLASGDWTNGLNWDCGCSPSLIHEVHIQTGHHIEMSADQTAASVIIEEGASLSIISESDNIVELHIYNSILNEGDLNAEAATLLINDNGEIHQLSGELEFRHVIFQSAGEVHINNTFFVNGRMDIAGTTLYTNDQLLFKLNNVGFKGIGTFESAEIVGEIGLTRDFDHPVNGYLDVAAGLQGLSFEDWNDNMLTTGFPGSDFPASTFASILNYDETILDEALSFVAPMSIEAAIEPQEGYYLYALAGEYTIDAFGTLVLGDQEVALDYTPQEMTSTQGLNFLGNPFVSTITVSNENAWQRTNTAAALYEWSSDRFSAYVKGIGVNGGDGILDPMDAFWMKATAADASVLITEDAKMLNNESETVNELIEITISDDFDGDQIAFALSANTSDDFDPEWDAQKLFSSTANVEIAWATNDLPLAIQRTDFDIYGKDYPILLTSNIEGEFNFELSSSIFLGEEACMAIEDTETGEIYPFTEEVNFLFESPVVDQQERFILHIGEAVIAEWIAPTCHDDFDASINIEGSGTGPWDYTWYNDEGVMIREMAGIETADAMSNLGAGNYIIEIQNNDWCYSLEVEAEIEAPIALEYFSSQTNVDCGEDETGSIEVELTGGVEPYAFEWSQGSAGNMLFDLSGGEYTMTATDANGCVIEQTFTIEEAEDVLASFEASELTAPLVNGQATIEFTNTSEGANDWLWSFGDGATLENINNPIHIYTEPGTYIVNLTAENEECSSSSNVIITIEEGVGINEQLAQGFDLLPSEQGWILETNWNSGRAEIDIYNLLGQKLMDTWTGVLGKDRLNLRVNSGVGACLIQIRRPDDQWINTVKRVRQF